MPTLTDEQIANTAKDYLEWALAQSARDVKVLAEGPYDTLDENGEVVRAVPLGQLGDGTLAGERSATETSLKEKRDQLANRHVDWALKPLAAEFAREQGIDIDKLDDASIDALLHAIQRAHVEQRRIHLAQLEGNYADAVTRDPLFAGVGLPLRTGSPKNAPKRLAIPTLSEAIERYCQSRTKAGMWVKKTQRDADRVLDWFMELTDASTLLTAISQDDIRAYHDAARRSASQCHQIERAERQEPAGNPRHREIAQG